MKIIRPNKVIAIVTFLLCGFAVHAQMGGAEPPQAEQKTPLQQAQEYAAGKEYNKALDLFQKIYEQNRTDVAVYNDYLNTLILAKKYKDAERLVTEQESLRIRNPLLYIDMGRIYQAQGKEKKANEQFDQSIQFINGDEMITQQMVNTYTGMGKEEYAIKAYERTRDLLGNPYLYADPLARLYTKIGQMDKAASLLLESGNIQFTGLENTKAALLELINNDPKKLQATQKVILNKINEHPENTSYVELLTWLYTQKNDWDGALLQMEALDERNKEHGQRILDFARMAVREKQFNIAVKAYTEVTDMGRNESIYPVAESEKLATRLQILAKDSAYKPADVAGLAKDYEVFMDSFPQYYATPMAGDYAMLEAQYNNNPQKGIDILNKAIAQPQARTDLVGRLKLQLGDYYILTGRVWDASLTYSQVDKAFKEDILGEEARFRNAKLAYYRGDFEWAQGQLEVLKASTSELIANDALYLSVLITENIGPDSDYVPLRRFAYADLLLFQNKDKEAETLLDSITTAYPKHPLNDDILMLRAKIAEKHHDYTKALSYLGDIYTQYGKDVLGDDAVFKMAEIYENDLHQKDQTKHYYEQLIIDYPGSTFVQTARKKLNDLNTPAPLP